MPRTARASVSGQCYHVLNRGNGQAKVFHREADFQRFATSRRHNGTCGSRHPENSMIPELVDHVLPEGVHDCTFEEVDQIFGRFWGSDHRIRLIENLAEFLDQARRSGIVAAVVIDGSFVTSKPSPQDIDLLVAYRPEFDWSQELLPFEYNVLSRAVIKRRFKFDVFIAADGSPEYAKWVAFFSRVRRDDPDQPTRQTQKGILRIAL